MGLPCWRPTVNGERAPGISKRCYNGHMNTPALDSKASEDASIPGGISYRLPFVIDAEDYGSTEQVINAAIRHVNYLKLSAFFINVSAAIEGHYHSVILTANFSDTEDWVELSAESALDSPTDAGVPAYSHFDSELSGEFEGMFPQDLPRDILEEAITFINDHACDQTAEGFKSLAREVWPDDLRPAMVASHLEQSVDPAAISKKPAPRI